MMIVMDAFSSIRRSEVRRQLLKSLFWWEKKASTPKSSFGGEGSDFTFIFLLLRDPAISLSDAINRNIKVTAPEGPPDTPGCEGDPNPERRRRCNGGEKVI